MKLESSYYHIHANYHTEVTGYMIKCGLRTDPAMSFVVYNFARNVTHHIDNRMMMKLGSSYYHIHPNCHTEITG